MGRAASAGGSPLCRWEVEGPSGLNVPPPVSQHLWESRVCLGEEEGGGRTMGVQAQGRSPEPRWADFRA